MEAGQVLTLEDADGVVYATRTITAGDLGGTISFPEPTGLADGTYQLFAVLRDAYGNVARSAQAYTLVVGTGVRAADSVAPAAPVITTAGGFTTPDPETVLTGTAEAYATVSLYEGDTLLRTVQAGQTGAWTATLPILGDGLHTVTAHATDRAGNVSETSTAISFTVSSLPPAPPVITGFAGDSAPVGDGRTTDDTLVLTGTAAAGSTVTLYRDGTAIGTAVANGSGVWTFDDSGTVLTAGTYQFRAKAQNALGQTSGLSGALVVTVVTGITPALTLDSVAGKDASKPENQSLSSVEGFAGAVLAGRVERGASVLLTIGGTSHTAWVEGDRWSYRLTDADLADLSAAGGAVSITATNAAGGTNTVATTIQTGAARPAVTVAAVAGDDIVAEAERTGLTVTGTVTAGAAVILTVPGTNAQFIATVTGTTWEYSFADTDFEALGTGPMTLRVTASNGGVSAVTDRAVTILPLAPTLTTVNAQAVADGLTTRSAALALSGSMTPGLTAVTVGWSWTSADSATPRYWS